MFVGCAKTKKSNSVLSGVAGGGGVATLCFATIRRGNLGPELTSDVTSWDQEPICWSLGLDSGSWLGNQLRVSLEVAWLWARKKEEDEGEIHPGSCRSA